MTAITIDEIRRDLLAYLRRVEKGEAFVILEADKPLAELKPAGVAPGQARPFALCAGEFRVRDCFDDPLPEETLRQFEGR